MKKSLAHLPKEKQDELEIIRDIILEKVPDVRMIILFGSYARNEWVQDTHLEGRAALSINDCRTYALANFLEV